MLGQLAKPASFHLQGGLARFKSLQSGCQPGNILCTGTELLLLTATTDQWNQFVSVGENAADASRSTKFMGGKGIEVQG